MTEITNNKHNNKILT